MNNKYNIWQDEYGVKYTEDRQVLIAAPRELKHYTIPEGVARIGMSAFQHCLIESIEIPDSAEAIFESAFEGCKRLKEVILPKNLLYIGSYAFRNCNALTGIIIPASTIYVGSVFIDKSKYLRQIKFLGQIERCTTTYYWILTECRNLERIEIPAGTLEHYSTKIFCEELNGTPSSNYLVESKEGCRALPTDAMAKYEALCLEEEETLCREEIEDIDSGEDDVEDRCPLSKRKYNYDCDDWEVDFDFEETEEIIDNLEPEEEYCEFDDDGDYCFDGLYETDESMSLGDSYLNEDNFYDAYRCYIKSARYKKDAFSMIRIGYCYEVGYGCTPDMDETLKWYRRAERVGRIGDTKVEMLFDFEILLRAIREVETRAANCDHEILLRQAHRHFYIIRDADGAEQSISLSNNKKLLHWFRRFIIRIKIFQMEEMMR